MDFGIFLLVAVVAVLGGFYAGITIGENNKKNAITELTLQYEGVYRKVKDEAEELKARLSRRKKPAA